MGLGLFRHKCQIDNSDEDSNVWNNRWGKVKFADPEGNGGTT